MIFPYKYFLVAGLLLLSVWGEAQHTYAWVYLLEEGKYEMLKGDFLTGEYEREFTLDTSRFTMHYGNYGESILDNNVNAFEYDSRNSNIFFIESFGNFYVYDISADSMSFIKDLTPYPPDSEESRRTFDRYHQIFDMRFVNDSLLYIAGRVYGYLNVNTYEFELIRELPNYSAIFNDGEKELTWHSSAFTPSDTFYLSYRSSLMHPDFREPASSIKICDHLINNPRPHLLYYQFNCDSADWFTFNQRLFRDSSEFRMYQFDIENCERTLIWRDSFFHTYKYDEIFISKVRHYNPSYAPCELFIDLDVEDNTVEGIDYRGSEVCRHSSLPLSDEEIKLRNSTPFDSVVLHIQNAEAEQYISVAPGNFAIQDNHTDRVLLYNNGNTELSDYRQAIENARFMDTSAYQPGTVNVEVSAWYDGMSSDTAHSIYSILPRPDAGANRELAYCPKDSLIDLKSELSVSDTGQFYNINGELVNDKYSISASGDTTLLYIMQGESCTDTAVWDITVYEHEVLEVEDQRLCPGQDFTVDLTALAGEIEWNDGSRDKVRTLTEEGSYVYSHTSNEGCSASDTFSIQILEEAIEVNIDTVICSGETFHYKGNTYDQPTLITDSVRSQGGCDSVIYSIDLDIQGKEDIIDEDSLWLCSNGSLSLDPGASYQDLQLNGNAVIRPLRINETGSYTLTATDEYGCYQTDSFSVGQRTSPSVTTEDLIDEVYVPGLELPVMYSGEIAYYTWRPGTHLSCSVCPYPELIEPGEGTYTITIINSYGCRDTAVIKITLAEPEVYVPNVIAIDAEKEENEVFYVHANGDFKYDMQIFNRWGNMEYEVRNASSNDISAGWRPDHTDHRAVFVYLIRIQFPSGKIKTLKGSVTVY